MNPTSHRTSSIGLAIILALIATAGVTGWFVLPRWQPLLVAQYAPSIQLVFQAYHYGDDQVRDAVVDRYAGDPPSPALESALTEVLILAEDKDLNSRIFDVQSILKPRPPNVIFGPNHTWTLPNPADQALLRVLLAAHAGRVPGSPAEQLLFGYINPFVSNRVTDQWSLRQDLQFILPRLGPAGIAQIKLIECLKPTDTNQAIDDRTMADLAHLTALEEIYLTGHPITDAGMEALGRLENLRVVCLTDMAIGDAGIAHLAHLDHLEILVLDNLALTDDGLRHIGSLPALADLDIRDMAITDAGLAHLHGLPQETHIYITGCQISEEGWSRYWRAHDAARLESPELAPEK